MVFKSTVIQKVYHDFMGSAQNVKLQVFMERNKQEIKGEK
jgi:hypothetical protein